MAKKKKKASGGQYVVTSKVKEAIKGEGYRTAGDAVDALNDRADDPTDGGRGERRRQRPRRFAVLGHRIAIHDGCLTAAAAGNAE